MLSRVRAPGTPYHELDLSEIPWLRHEVEVGPKGLTRYRRIFFLAGILAGAVLAWTFSHHVVVEARMQQLRGVIDEQLGSFGINISSMDLSFSMPSELVSLSNDLFTAPKKWTEQKDFSVGSRLRDKENIERVYPVVLLPGIVSTALESWTTDSGNFRKKLWGGVSMIRTVATQKVCIHLLCTKALTLTHLCMITGKLDQASQSRSSHWHGSSRCQSKSSRRARCCFLLCFRVLDLGSYN